jgi:hypothetical protein
MRYAVRAAILALILMLTAAPALAAPTCWDREGRAARCGTAGAGPVGAALTPEQSAARLAIPTYRLSAREAFALAAVVGGLFGLIVLMPRFNGRWDDD